MLRMLGQSEYGLYSLAHSAVSYLSLLSFGFGSTIIRYIAKYRAENNKDALQRTYGFFILLYSLLAILVLIGGIIISQNIEPIFHQGLTSSEQSKMRILVLIMTFNTALSFPISVFSSIITAYERYVYRKIIDMFATLGAPIANLIALYLGYASVGMSVAATVIQFIMLPLYAGYCFKVLKLKPKFSILPKSLIKELFGFSMFVFLGSLVDMLFWSTDKVILGMLSSSTAVAIYNVGGTFNNIVMQHSNKNDFLTCLQIHTNNRVVFIYYTSFSPTDQFTIIVCRTIKIHCKVKFIIRAKRQTQFTIRKHIRIEHYLTKTGQWEQQIKYKNKMFHIQAIHLVQI